MDSLAKDHFIVSSRRLAEEVASLKRKQRSGGTARENVQEPGTHRFMSARHCVSSYIASRQNDVTAMPNESLQIPCNLETRLCK